LTEKGDKGMAKTVCPKCQEPLDEVIRVIQVRCRYNEAEDDYLMDTDEGSVDLCPKCHTDLEE
jgi:hypothetical protein